MQANRGNSCLMLPGSLARTTQSKYSGTKLICSLAMTMAPGTATGVASQCAQVRGLRYNDVWKTADGASWELVTAEAEWSPRAATALQVHSRALLIGLVERVSMLPRCGVESCTYLEGEYLTLVHTNPANHIPHRQERAITSSLLDLFDPREPH